MPRYSLIAARDGDLFSDVGEQPDQAAAEDWAKQRVAEFFGLDALNFDDFDDIVAETDGLKLTELAPDGVGWAGSKRRSVGPRAQPTPPGCRIKSGMTRFV